jgi:hypothetical protein
MPGAEHRVGEPAGRSERERQRQAREHQAMRNTALLGIEHFPGPDEQIEGEIVNLAGQE